MDVEVAEERAPQRIALRARLARLGALEAGSAEGHRADRHQDQAQGAQPCTADLLLLHAQTPPSSPGPSHWTRSDRRTRP